MPEFILAASGALILLIILLILGQPLLIIAALNTVFPALQIKYSIATYFSVLFLETVIFFL